MCAVARYIDMIYKYFTLFIVCLGFVLSSYGQNLEMSVVQNRNTRSISEDGAIFTLEIANTSNSAQSFEIVVEQVAESCDSKKMANYSSKLNLKTEFITTERQKQGSRLTIGPRSTHIFYLKVSSPDEKRTDVWSCLNVALKSSSFKNLKKTPASTSLRWLVRKNLCHFYYFYASLNNVFLYYKRVTAIL